MPNIQTTIGKTAPVPLGQQKAVNSLPVVFAEDQPAIPVEEQNKVQSEVALSLLGIPRAEVALGIFADVNTYDINPNEWSQSPIENEFNGSIVQTGLNHLEKEAGAELVAAEGRTTILTSKRFFRYQPGRVSSSTMGVKMSVTNSTYDTSNANRDQMKGAPSIKKWGIFDQSDGYYFEVVNGGDKNDFRCVRRTQALIPSEPDGLPATPDGWARVTAPTGVNIKGGNWGVVGTDPVIFRNGLCYVAAAIHDPSLCYTPTDVRSVESGAANLSDFTYNEAYALRLAYNTTGSTFVEHLANRQFAFPFDQRIRDNSIAQATYDDWQTRDVFLHAESGFNRLDAHCKWQDLVTNLSRGGGTGFTGQIDVVGSQLSVLGNNARFGYDPDPSEADSSVKVWNLLVSVQGSAQITNAQYSAAFPSPHRTLPYDVTNAAVGRRNVTLKEWFKICVPPEYRKVYEWRPIRSMFSDDQLNGLSDNIVRWSDVSTANVEPSAISVKRPGDVVEIDGEPLIRPSVYEVDFTKVTMWKIDFSWYGAVGALFLCYVPVANNEARWVRVHHMRASNQLDVASLGNATLPITYLTHSGRTTPRSTLVKYGASYYIDGGDKGTVKLLSKSSDFAKSVGYAGVKIPSLVSSTSNQVVIAPVSGITQSTKDQLIDSYLRSDQTTKVVWVANEGGSNIRLFFNRTAPVAGPIELMIPRRQRSMVSLRSKDTIVNTTGTPIRNRVQLYPIKYSTGVTDSSADANILTVNFIKNPLVITNNLNNSTLAQLYNTPIYTSSASQGQGFELGSGKIPKTIVTGTNITSGNLATLTALLPLEGDYLHCYVRGLPTASVPVGGFDATPSVQETPVLVRLFRKGANILVQNYTAQPAPVSIFGEFLPVRMYTFTTAGDLSSFTGEFTGHTKFEDQKKWNESAFVGSFQSIAQLSGASVSQDFRLAPVPETGNIVFSLYTNKGGSQYDLTDFFAYNKEYLSYPLTNEVDTLNAYAMWESTSNSSQPNYSLSLVNSLTWEEQ